MYQFLVVLNYSRPAQYDLQRVTNDCEAASHKNITLRFNLSQRQRKQLFIKHLFFDIFCLHFNFISVTDTSECSCAALPSQWTIKFCGEQQSISKRECFRYLTKTFLQSQQVFYSLTLISGSFASVINCCLHLVFFHISIFFVLGLPQYITVQNII